MSQVSVLGLGHWGTALAQHLAEKGFTVVGWSNEPDVVAGITKSHKNPRYLGHVPLAKTLSATGDLSAALKSENVVLAVPSGALSEVVPQLKLLPTATLISAVKGIERKSKLTPLQFASKHLPGPAKLAVISGPSFAKDVIVHKPCGIVAASEDEAVARAVADLFTGLGMKVYYSTDPLGVELGGIIKNVIALAVGMADGLELGDSARAGLVTRGLAEMTRLATALGAEAQTLAGLSGLGDLVMTATCDTSRNRTVGLKLGRGEKLTQIIETLGSTAEGVTTTPLVLELAAEQKIEMPITQGVAMVLSGKVSAKDMATQLIARPIKAEF